MKTSFKHNIRTFKTLKRNYIFISLLSFALIISTLVIFINSFLGVFFVLFFSSFLLVGVYNSTLNIVNKNQKSYDDFYFPLRHYSMFIDQISILIKCIMYYFISFFLYNAILNLIFIIYFKSQNIEIHSLESLHLIINSNDIYTKIYDSAIYFQILVSLFFGINTLMMNHFRILLTLEFKIPSMTAKFINKQILKGYKTNYMYNSLYIYLFIIVIFVIGMRLNTIYAQSPIIDQGDILIVIFVLLVATFTIVPYFFVFSINYYNYLKATTIIRLFGKDFDKTIEKNN